MLLLTSSVYSSENPIDSFNKIILDGCMDLSACNYNPNASEDNGSCCYAACGCLDPEAANFSLESECDDNSCLYLSDCSLIEPDVSENQSVCRGGMLEIMTENEFVNGVKWFIDGELISEESDLYYTPEVEGEMEMLMIYSNDFCVDTTEIALEVFVLESPELTYDGLQFCEGESADIETAGGFQNVWIHGSQFFSLNESVTVTNGGIYSVVNVDEDCVSNSVAVVVTVYTIPEAEILFSSTDICEGNYVQLHSVDEGEYVWLQNGEPYSINQSTQTSSEGEFTLQVNNNQCISNIDSVILTERENPETPDIEFDNGVLTATQIDDVSYVWYLNGTMEEETEVNYFTPTISGNYRVEVMSEYLCTTSSEALFVTDISEISESEIQIYPNPMKDLVNIDLGDNVIDRLLITDSQGRVVQEIENRESASIIQINRQTMASGIYHLRLYNKDTTVKLKRLMVK